MQLEVHLKARGDTFTSNGVASRCIAKMNEYLSDKHKDG